MRVGYVWTSPSFQAAAGGATGRVPRYRGEASLSTSSGNRSVDGRVLDRREWSAMLPSRLGRGSHGGLAPLSTSSSHHVLDEVVCEYSILVYKYSCLVAS